MSRNKKEVPMWAKTGHTKPVTRRDFLSAGITGFTASLFVPQWISMMMSSQAHADMSAIDCTSSGGFIPFITLNLSGGAALASNFVPMNAERTPIKSYSKIGLGDNKLPIEMEFGNVPFAGLNGGALISKFLVGVRSQAVATTLAKTAFVGIPCDSQNDTSANKFDIAGAITKAGLMGANFPNIFASTTSNAIKQAAALVIPPSPLAVNNYSSLLNSIGYTAAVQSSLNKKQQGHLAKLLRDLNGTQSRSFASVNNAVEIQKVIGCAGIKNIELISNGSGVIDPRNSNPFAQVWGINANTAGTNRELIFGASIYNSLLGQAGVCNLELGGYDYHDNTRTTGDAKDLDAGTVVGRILQSAAVLQKPVFIYVVSDGSVSSNDSSGDRSAPWVGDRGSNGCAYFLYFDPVSRPITSDFQIGSFNDNQAADTSFITGSNPELVAAAVFANWCQANKRMDLFERIAGRPFNPTQMSEILKIA
jgi:hypothetical protein